MSLSIKFLEKKKFEAKCRTHKITIDQPISNHGLDQGMNPIELFNAAIASCAAFYAMTFLNRRIKDLKGLKVESSWSFAENPYRIGEISLNVKLPDKISEPSRKGLLRSIEHCPLKNTLDHTPKINIKLTSLSDRSK